MRVPFTRQKANKTV